VWRRITRAADPVLGEIEWYGDESEAPRCYHGRQRVSPSIRTKRHVQSGGREIFDQLSGGMESARGSQIRGG
jgi:hypothetical protein